MVRKWQREDNREGSLNSEQHLLWDGPWPDEARRQHLPDLLERAHFRSVERYSFGIVRCRREGLQVVCRLFDWHRLPALVFVDSGTRVTADLVEREWVIGPGLMARRGPAADVPYGSLRVGLQRVEEHGVTRVHAYERVEGFPSRFLRQPDALAGNARSWGWAQVGALYSAYHARAAFGALRWIAAVLNQGQRRAGAPEVRPPVLARRAGGGGSARARPCGAPASRWRQRGQRGGGAALAARPPHRRQRIRRRAPATGPGGGRLPGTRGDPRRGAGAPSRP